MRVRPVRRRDETIAPYERSRAPRGHFKVMALRNVRLTEWDENYSSAGRPTTMQTAAIVVAMLPAIRF